MDKIKTIINKEWSEVFKNRLVLFTVLFLPLIFVVLPVITIVAMQNIEMSESEMSEVPEAFAETICAGIESGIDCINIYTLNLFTLMFMILPVAIPVTIAAYSIVGEKTTRSLEPLLATPITTAELLLGKAIAAIAPAIVATWLSFIIYAVIARLFTTAVVFAHVLDPMWLLAIFVVGPLLTLLAASVAIMVSSRVSDPRVAEQLSMVVILPIILVLIGQSVGLFLLNRQIVLVAAVVIALIDVVLLYLAVQLFERETILTRWR
jgi:ABC-2 type transport system permease protein